MSACCVLPSILIPAKQTRAKSSLVAYNVDKAFQTQNSNEIYVFSMILIRFVVSITDSEITYIVLYHHRGFLVSAFTSIKDGSRYRWSQLLSVQNCLSQSRRISYCSAENMKFWYSWVKVLLSIALELTIKLEKSVVGQRKCSQLHA